MQQPKPKRRPKQPTKNRVAWKSHRLNGDEYLGEMAAREYIGRGRTTLFEWRRRGSVVARKVKAPDGYIGWVYHKGSLRIALADANRRKAEQLRVSGTGRGNYGPTDPAKLADRRAVAERKRAEREAEKAARKARMRAAAEAAEREDDRLYALSHASGAVAPNGAGQSAAIL